jgi:hypothetical protein
MRAKGCVPDWEFRLRMHLRTQPELQESSNAICDPIFSSGICGLLRGVVRALQDGSPEDSRIRKNVPEHHLCQDRRR